MKRVRFFAAVLLLLFVLPLNAWAAESLIPVGKVIGLQLRSDKITVVAFDDILGGGARDAGLRIGDELLAVDRKEIYNAAEIAPAIQGKERIVLTVRRGSKELELEVPVQREKQGEKLGIYLRQGVAGIGTVTWYDPDTGLFGALGHGVSDHNGTILAMTGGSAFDAVIESVKRGKAGHPGQLRGLAREDEPRGNLLKNTPQGVFGKTEIPWEGESIPTALYEEIQPGQATILATVDGTVTREYSVEILKIYPRDRADWRNFLLRVTDPELLEITGGIVQGMSGSPILQNGKLVGAVTHVLVNDPATGYGIYIENMLEAAG